MKQWKKLFFIVVALPVSLLWSKNCDDSCSTDCNTDCNTSNACCVSDVCCSGGQIINKSVYVNPITRWASGAYLHEYMFRNNRMEMGDDCSWGSAFQVAVFGGATTNDGRGDLGRRFGLNGKNCMKAVEGDDATRIANGGVINPIHFNVLTQNDGVQPSTDDFISTFCFCPKETQVGALLSWKQSLCSNDEGLVRWWFEINAPIVHTKHTMGFSEDVTQNGGGVKLVDGAAPLGLDGAPVVADMKAAFKQASWKYGKADNCYRSNTELANLEFKIGYNSLTQGECCKVGSYLGFAAPTTEKRTAEYIFEPIAGQEHWAIIWGSTFDIRMCEWENSCFMAHLAVDGRWWFERNELRTFDLLGKPWGRYQAMYLNQEQAATANTDDNELSGTSGINIMTRCVDVTPGYQINFNAAFAYQGCKWSAEFGHTFYARQAEHIKANWVAGPALKDVVNGAGQTNAATTIGRDYAGSATVFADYDQNIIQTCDVDWNTGSHEGVLGNSIYGAIGYSMDDWCYPTFIGFGGDYDFGTEDHGTSIMRAWNVFGKLDITF